MRTLFNNPLLPCSMKRHTVELMTRAAAHGTMSAHRTSLRPKNSRLRNWASPREMTIEPATTARTQVAVLPSTCPSAGSANRAR